MALLHKDFRPGTGYHVEGVSFYHTYRFRAEEQDPVVDKLQTMMEDEMGDVTKGRFGKLHEMTGLSTSTLSNWFVTRKTRRPQYASIVALSRALGYDVAFVKTGNKANGAAWEASAPRIISRFRRG